MCVYPDYWRAQAVGILADLLGAITDILRKAKAALATTGAAFNFPAIQTGNKIDDLYLRPPAL